MMIQSNRSCLTYFQPKATSMKQVITEFHLGQYRSILASPQLNSAIVKTKPNATLIEVKHCSPSIFARSLLSYKLKFKVNQYSSFHCRNICKTSSIDGNPRKLLLLLFFVWLLLFLLFGLLLLFVFLLLLQKPSFKTLFKSGH